MVVFVVVGGGVGGVVIVQARRNSLFNLGTPSGNTPEVRPLIVYVLPYYL